MTEQTVLALITCQTYPEPSDNLKTLAACLENMGVKTVFDAWQNHLSAPFCCLCVHGIMTPNPKPSANGWSKPSGRGSVLSIRPS